MRTLLILAVFAVVVMWALLVGGTIDDQPVSHPHEKVKLSCVQPKDATGAPVPAAGVTSTTGSGWPHKIVLKSPGGRQASSSSTQPVRMGAGSGRAVSTVTAMAAPRWAGANGSPTGLYGKNWSARSLADWNSTTFAGFVSASIQRILSLSTGQRTSVVVPHRARSPLVPTGVCEGTTSSSSGSSAETGPAAVAASAPSSTHASTSAAKQAEPAPTERVTTGNVWDRVAACESGGRWDDTRGGYFGGLHFMRDTWLRAGGGRFAPTANLATREQQITIAKAWLARTSVKQWPVCGPKVGLTMADAA